MGEQARLDVKCDVCGNEGSVKIGEMESVSCPQCGARYIAWVPPGKLRLELRCVVRPVFERRTWDRRA